MFSDYIFRWEAAWQALPQLIDGTWTSLQIAAVSILGGCVIGIAAAMASLSSSRVLARASLIYIESMRNSPSLVKMYFIYFGLPTLGVFPSAFLSAVVALALHNGAYMAEIFRGGLQTVSRSQLEAAHSLGMGPWLTFRIVLFPQAFRNAIPSLSNNWVEIVKDTSLTSALAVKELFYVTTQLISSTLRCFELLAVVALIYLVLTSGVSGALRLVEVRTKYRR